MVGPILIGITGVVIAHLIIGIYKAIKHRIELKKTAQELVDSSIATIRKR